MPVAITIPTSAAEHSELRFAYDSHTWEHPFEECATCVAYREALDAFEIAREAEHESNMTAIEFAEHRAYGECIQFDGDVCPTCDDFYAQDRRTA